MKHVLSLAAAALAIGLPLGAAAQSAPDSAPGGPPPEMRARMERARDDARAAALGALSAAHRTQVQAILDQLNSGKLNDPRAAAAQIDGLLTADESKAVLAAHDKAVASFHRDGNPPPGAPQGPPPGAAPPDARGAPTAGRVLVMLGVNRDRMHEMMRAMHDGA
ncbi:hypothetical protein WPS_08420 [Vulcanimicrobium alpinum]|uniref:Periplasmic heavy metal sensor n=1 Tax=Vulcanimicrobium alpinum TaxID=3016050 RepID=A0AAN1XU17_UNVUL|nr:hypothetical protein [Vulcanimicrobium alpinum]BDE05566.1 hypothetical protein WPS_08420 [Vulcanimicrobium alpinum]